ncbi:MAG TPA: type II secretion system protein N [Methylomirabilota bacterium]|nr:type II secretion system protein N [Methylomirabilota bacterium]
MSRRLLVINVALGIVSVVLAVGIFRTLLAKRPLPPPSAPRAVSAPAPAVAAQAGDAGPGAYSVVAARNLFNPSRSETAAVAAAPVSKPILHGVVMNGSKSRAFLEDPTFKRVAGYSVGDTVGGGTLDKIADDRVVITRPEGPLEILLQDPAKPRATPTAAAAPAQVGPAQVGPAQVGSPPSLVPPAIPQMRQGIPPQRQPGQ